jgi:hypothetical protein
MADEEKPVIEHASRLASGAIAPGASNLPEKADEPPVVARLIVEIRSDGRRTIARGALQDASIGQEVAIRAEGTTPLALAASLMRSIFSGPLLGRIVARALTGGSSAKKRPPGR